MSETWTAADGTVGVARYVKDRSIEDGSQTGIQACVRLWFGNDHQPGAGPWRVAFSRGVGYRRPKKWLCAGGLSRAC